MIVPCGRNSRGSEQETEAACGGGEISLHPSKEGLCSSELFVLRREFL